MISILQIAQSMEPLQKNRTDIQARELKAGTTLKGVQSDRSSNTDY